MQFQNKLSNIWNEIKLLSSLQWINVVAAIITILGVPAALFVHIEGEEGKYLVIAVSFLFALAWVLLIAQEFRYSRKARYGEAMKNIHDSFHKLRDASYFLKKEAADETIVPYLKESINSLSSAFSLITGVHCRVCVKELTCPDPNTQDKKRALIVTTLCRSDESPEPLGEAQNDYVTDNSDFLVLFNKPAEKCFFINDLTKKKGYRNSHWTEEVVEREMYDYISTIVWPIRKRIDAPSKSSLHPTQDILGFLCVDSLARGVFEKRYDVWLGASYADTFYTVFKAFRELKEQQAESQ